MEQAQQALDAATLAARMMLECGGEIYRAEETAIRMCHAFGLRVADIMCFPTGLVLSVTLENGENLSRVYRIRERTLQLEQLDQVNSISRAVAAGQLDPEGACQALEAFRRKAPPSPLLLSAAFAVSAGFFSVMFGGGLKEFVIAFLAGGLTQGLIPVFRRLHAQPLLIPLIAGILASGGALILIRLMGGNQEAAISGAIMPLLPGLAMTNAVRDTMRGDLVAGMARSVEALLSAALIAAAVALVLML